MDNFFKDLLAQDGFTNPSVATQIKMLARNYVKKAEEREAEFKIKEAEFEAKKVEFKAAEEKYLSKIVDLTNQNFEKDKFLSIIAHDLKSPFNAFLGLSEVLKEGIQNMSSEELSSIAGSMNKSAESLFQLLENLLEWAKVRTNKTQLNLKTVSLFETVLRVESLYGESVRAKGIGVRNEVPTDLTLKCDDHILETVLRNLVGNAVKFCPKGNKITISAEKIDQEKVKFSVSDTGIGMSKEMAGKMFQLNSNTRRPGTAGEKSSGLGLLLCKELVELHGGEIWVESKEGVGSTFHFTIPLDSKQQNPSATSHNQVLAANN